MQNKYIFLQEGPNFLEMTSVGVLKADVKQVE